MAFPTTAIIKSYRQNGIVIFQVTDLDINGNQGVVLALPNEIDAVYVLEVFVRVRTIATMMTNPELNGPHAMIIDAAQPAFPILDPIGTSRWVVANGLTLAAQIDPDAAALWSKGELFNVQFAEPDTNATPTADAEVVIRCQTLKPIGGVPGPLQLTS